jgi:hypothetical protein
MVFLHALFDLKVGVTEGEFRRALEDFGGICKKNATSSTGDGCGRSFHQPRPSLVRRKHSSWHSNFWMSRPSGAATNTWHWTKNRSARCIAR